MATTKTQLGKTGNLPFKINKRNLIIILAVIVLGAFLYNFRGQFIAATVNGKPVWRFTLLKELEKQAGKQTLDSLITRTLILQEANKQKVTVGVDELNQEIKKIEENLSGQGQDLDYLLSAQGMTRDQLKEQIRIQKLVEKMAGQNIEVADEEVDKYLEQNKSLITKDSNVEEVKAGIREQLRQQKLTEQVQSWLKSLRDGASINYLLSF